MTDFADLEFDGIESDELKAARSKNFAPLASKVRDGRRLNDEERQFIADRLEGKIALKSGEKTAPQFLDGMVWEAYVYKVEYLGDKPTIAKEDVASLLGETKRSISDRIERAEKSRCNRADVTSRVSMLRLAIRLYTEDAAAIAVSEPILLKLSPSQIDSLKGIKVDGWKELSM